MKFVVKMLSLQIEFSPEGCTSSDRKFYNQLVDLVGNDIPEQEENGFSGEDIVTPPHNSHGYKRASSPFDDELKVAKAIKLDFNISQQTLDQNDLVMSVRVDQQTHGNSIADKSLMNVTKDRPKFYSDPSSWSSKI